MSSEDKRLRRLFAHISCSLGPPHIEMEEDSLGDYVAFEEAYPLLTTLQQIAALRPDQGHDAVMLAREMLGMQVERWGCFCETGPDESPQDCVIDDPNYIVSDCVYAIKLVEAGKNRADCKEWRKY